MDEISQLIREQYPITYNVLPNGGKSLSISYAENLPTEMKSGILAILDRFILPIVNNRAELTAEVYMSPCPDTNEACLTLRCNGCCFYFPDGDPGETLAWTLYGLTQGVPSLSSPHPKKLRAELYSVEQQRLAAAMLATVQYWEADVCPDALAELFRTSLGKNVGRFSLCAPLFSGRPLTEEGWHLMLQSKAWYARKKEWRMREIADALYGQGSYLAELNAFCMALGNTEAFQQTLEESVEELMKEICARPVINVEFQLNAAIAILQGELEREETQAKNAVREALSGKATMRRIDPEDIFAGLDKECSTLVRVQIEKLFLKELETLLSDAVTRTLPAAQMGIWAWRRSLQDFCRIDPAQNRMVIGWDWFSSSQMLPLPGRMEAWDEQALRSLQANAGTLGRYITSAWFCAPHLQALCTLVPSSTWPVKMTGTAVVALMEDIVEEENDG